MLIDRREVIVLASHTGLSWDDYLLLPADVGPAIPVERLTPASRKRLDALLLDRLVVDLREGGHAVPQGRTALLELETCS